MSMKTGLKIVSGVLALGAVVVIASAVYVVNFDPNENKALIASKFKDATGRDLALNGDIGLTLFPWLGLTLNDVSISNAAGFSSDPMLHANQAAVRIKLLPLLSSEYEIDTIRLNSVQLRLEVAGNGTNNWSDLSDASATGTSASTEADSSGLNKLILGGVDIQNTSVIYDNKNANTHYEINDLNVQIGELVYGAPLDVKLSLQALSRKPQLRADLALTGTVLYDIDNGRYQLDPLQLSATLMGPTVPGNTAKLTLNSAFSIDTKADTLSLPSLQFSALDTDITGSLNVSDLQSETPSLQGNLKVQGNDLGVLFRILEQDELAVRIRSLDSKFSLQAEVDANMQSGEVQVPTLQASLLGATINGNLVATQANTDKPTVSGNLQAQGPDLPTLIEVIGILQSGTTTSSGTPSALAQTGRDLGRISHKRFSLQSEFTADMDNGNIQLPALTANLLGFDVKATLNAHDIQGNGGKIDGSLTMQSDTIGEVLAALGQPGMADIAKSLALDVNVGGDGSKLLISPLNLSLVVAGGQLGNAPQTLAFNADTNVNLDGNSLSVDAFTLSGVGLNLHGKLAASQLSTSPSFVGELNLATFNARQFMRQLNMQAPNTADAVVLQKLSMTTHFSGTDNSLALNDYHLTLDDSTLSGNVKLDDLSSMRGSFAINIDSINVDRYLAPTTETPTAAANSAASPLPVDALRSLNLQGKLAIEQLTISGLKLNKISVPLNAANGVIALNPISAQLYDGEFTGNLALNVSGQESIATVITTLSSINLGPLTQDFMQANYLTGIGNIELSLEGRGNDSHVIQQNLNGAGALTIADGVLAGVDVGAALTAVETMIRSKSLVTLPAGGSTPFENFSATLNIDNGVVASNDLVIKAPGWQITGAGTLADLRRNSIDFDLVAAVDTSTATVAAEKYDIGGHKLPIACTGSPNSPRCLPDAKAIIASAVTNAVQERLGNFLHDRLGGGEQQPSPTPNNATEQQPAEPAAEPPKAPSAEQQLLNNALDRLRRK
jgi:AsmA protein